MSEASFIRLLEILQYAMMYHGTMGHQSRTKKQRELHAARWEALRFAHSLVCTAYHPGVGR